LTVRSDRDDSLVQRAKALIGGGMSQRKAAAQVGMPQSSLSEALKREGYEQPPVTANPDPASADINDEQASITSQPLTDARGITPDELLLKHALDPEEWVVTSVRVSEWGNTEEPMFQLRVNASRRASLPTAPDLGDIEPREYAPAGPFSSGSVAFLADPHCPFMDEECFSATLAYLRDEEPSLVVHLGDIGNHGHISKHRAHPRFMETTNATCAAAARYFYDCVNAAPDAEHVFLPGNHDQRILYYMQDHAEKLFGIQAPALPNEEAPPQELLSFDTVYRLHDLGVKLIDDDWKLAQYSIVSELTARHGYLTGNNAERKLLETHGRSQVHGHLHRGEIVYRTKHDPLDVRVAMSVPTLAQVDSSGLGYQPDADWTPGIGVAQVWDDEKFVVSIAPFIDGELLCPDGRRFAAA
jgi:predicted phosphodiesterase